VGDDKPELPLAQLAECRRAVGRLVDVAEADLRQQIANDSPHRAVIVDDEDVRSEVSQGPSPEFDDVTPRRGVLFARGEASSRVVNTSLLGSPSRRCAVVDLTALRECETLMAQDQLSGSSGEGTGGKWIVLLGRLRSPRSHCSGGCWRGSAPLSRDRAASRPSKSGPRAMPSTPRSSRRSRA